MTAATGKIGLKVRDVAKDHFSSGVKLNEPKFSRLVVRFLEGKSLLASDIETGKSDPVCFVWCGPTDENPDLNNFADESSGITLTSVCPITVDPIWNEDLTFRLDVSDITELIYLKCAICCRDEDIIDGNISYDELGMIEVPLKDVIQKGKACANSIVMSAAWYKLNKGPGMRRVDGSLKLTISIIFGADDEATIRNQLQNNELLKNAASNSATSRQSLTQNQSTAVQCQTLLKYAIDPSLVPTRNSHSDGINESSSRAGSPFGRVSSARLRGNRRPASASRSMSSRTMDTADDGDNFSLNGSISSASFVPSVKRPSSAPSKRRMDRGRGRGRRGFSGLATAPAAPPPLIEESEMSDENSSAPERPTGDDDFEEELHVVARDVLENAVGVASRHIMDEGPTGNDTELQDEMELLNRVGGGESVTASSEKLRISVAHSPSTENAQRQLLAHAGAVADGPEGVPEQAEADHGDVDHANANEHAHAQDQRRKQLDGIHIDIEGRDMAQLLAEAGEGPTAGDECGLLEDFITIGLDVVKDRIGDLEVTRFGDSVGTASQSVAKKLAKTAKAIAHAGGVPNKLTSAAAGASARLQHVTEAHGKPQIQGIKTDAVTGTATGAAVISEALEKVGAGAVDRADETQDAGLARAGEVAEETPKAGAAASATVATAAVDGQLDDAAAALAAPSQGDMLIDDAFLPKNEPESAHEPSSSSGAGAQGAQGAQGEREEQLAVNHAGQGTTTAVVRALKEMSEQRKMMQQSLQQIAKATQSGFSKLTNRMDTIERVMHERTASYVGERGIDYQDMFSDEEDDEGGDGGDNRGDYDDNRGRGKDSDDEYALRRDGCVVRKQKDKARAGTYPSSRGSNRNSNSNGNNSNSSNNNIRHHRSSTGRGMDGDAQRSRSREGERGSSRQERHRSRSPRSPERSKSSSAGKRYGSSDLIRQAKLAAAKAAKASSTSEQPTASTSSAPPASTDMQLVMKGADGTKVTTAIASPDKDQVSPQSASSPLKGLTPSSEEVRNTQFNRHIPPYGDSMASSLPLMSSPQPQSYQQNMQLSTLPPLPMRDLHTHAHSPLPGGSYYLPSSSGTVNQLLNKDFADVLERGTLEEVGYMLENTAPKPEELSPLVRNRLFDAVATLLLQKQHVERCLIWVLALTRSGHLNEMARHSKRDLQEALETAALEPSKRGLLASLLKSQVK